MMRLFQGSALLLGAALLFGQASGAHAADVSVIDGDTLLHNGVQVEIWGIIAPSKTETCTTSGGEKWPCGERAFEALSQAASDETFECETKEQGFVLCHAGGLDVGALLVKEGLVRARQDYRSIEARARDAKVGLWE